MYFRTVVPAVCVEGDSILSRVAGAEKSRESSVGEKRGRVLCETRLIGLRLGDWRPGCRARHPQQTGDQQGVNAASVVPLLRSALFSPLSVTLKDTATTKASQNGLDARREISKVGQQRQATTENGGAQIPDFRVARVSSEIPGSPGCERTGQLQAARWGITDDPRVKHTAWHGPSRGKDKLVEEKHHQQPREKKRELGYYVPCWDREERTKTDRMSEGKRRSTTSLTPGTHQEHTPTSVAASLYFVLWVGAVISLVERQVRVLGYG